MSAAVGVLVFEDLDGNGSIESCISCLVHIPGLSTTNQRVEVVRPDIGVSAPRHNCTVLRMTNDAAEGAGADLLFKTALC